MKSKIIEVTKDKQPPQYTGGRCWYWEEVCDNCGHMKMKYGQVLSYIEPNANEKDYCKKCYSELFPDKVKDSLYKYFKHMEDEEKKCILGGMVWDDICWHIHDAVEFGISKEQLAKDFPSLLGHITGAENK